MKKQYEVILIDLDNTLFDYDKGEAQAFKKTMRHFKLPESCYEYYKVINKGYWDRLELGQVTKDALKIERFNDLMAVIAPEAQIDVSLLADTYVDMLSKEAHLFKDAKAVLRALKPYYKLIALSNGIEKVQMNRLSIAHMTDFFDAIVISEAVGANKPSPVIFNAALDAAGLSSQYHKALMIGDNLKADVDGAMRLGIKSIWMNYDGRDNNTDVKPDHEIKEISSLLAYLGVQW